MKLSRQAKAVISEVNVNVASIKDVKRGGIDPQINMGIADLHDNDFIYVTKSRQQMMNEIFMAYFHIRDGSPEISDEDIKQELKISSDTLAYLKEYFSQTNYWSEEKVFNLREAVLGAVYWCKIREFDRKGYKGITSKIAVYCWSTYHIADFIKEVGEVNFIDFIKLMNTKGINSENYPLKALWHNIPVRNISFLVGSLSYNNKYGLRMTKDQIRKVCIMQGAFLETGDTLSRDLGSYLYCTNYCKGLSITEFKYMIEGIKFWTNAHIGMHIRNVSPSVFVTLGKLKSNELRYAALHEVNMQVEYTFNLDRFSYILGKGMLNWEYVKEVQDLMVAGKNRLVLNHVSQPKARKFFKEHGVYVQSRNIPSVINVKALNMMKKESIHLTSADITPEEMMIDTIKIANIFGIHAVDVLTKTVPSEKRGKYIDPHSLVNYLNISSVNHVLSQQWNQFFFKNEELARYAGYVQPDMEIFKSKEQFMQFVRTQKYTNVPEGFEHLVDLCARHELSNNDFQRFISKVKDLTNKTSEMLPFIRIDGSTIEGVGHNYTLEKLDADDPAVLLIGLDTSCCQHIGGVGKSCAIHSYEQADSAIYVVRKNGQIVAQSWVWRNQDNGVVFDSIEVNVSERNRYEPIALMFKELANQLLGKLMIDSVYIAQTGYGMTQYVLSVIGKLLDSVCATRMITPCSYMDGRNHYLVAHTPEYSQYW